MTIRDRNKYRDAAWDWSFLNKCFADTAIRLSDIDGVVERHGYFLFIEAKPTNKKLSIGQEILLTKLSAIPRVTVLILWGENGEPVCMKQMGYEPVVCTKDDVVRVVSEWFTNAQKNGNKTIR